MNIGFTTSIPVEVIFASGNNPIDLNNIFINNNPKELVKKAELAGFPRNMCSWIKGMYSVIQKQDLDLIIGVIQGDCSNTHTLLDLLQDHANHSLHQTEKKLQIFPFSYPFTRNYQELNKEITKLENYFSVSREQTILVKKSLDCIRQKLVDLDTFTWQTNQVSSLENHTWLVSASDFKSNYNQFENELSSFLTEVKTRKPLQKHLRIGYVGVPPIINDLYTFIESLNTRVVYNEVQRQFSMFYLEQDIVQQYRKFSYPYTLSERIQDIKTEIERRHLQGIIVYTQSFCHRQLELLTLKKYLNIPILPIEGDLPGNLDARNKLRIESFVEMLMLDQIL